MKLTLPITLKTLLYSPLATNPTDHHCLELCVEKCCATLEANAFKQHAQFRVWASWLCLLWLAFSVPRTSHDRFMYGVPHYCSMSPSFFYCRSLIFWGQCFRKHFYVFLLVISTRVDSWCISSKGMPGQLEMYTVNYKKCQNTFHMEILPTFSFKFPLHL
jgi:hypothetical protein